MSVNQNGRWTRILGLPLALKGPPRFAWFVPGDPNESAHCTNRSYEQALAPGKQKTATVKVREQQDVRQKLGRCAERTVARSLTERGATRVYQGVRTKYAQVDLIAFKEQQWYIIEVKALSNFKFTHVAIKRAQLNRLQHVQLALAQASGYEVHLIWALVNSRGEIHWIRDFDVV